MTSVDQIKTITMAAAIINTMIPKAILLESFMLILGPIVLTFCPLWPSACFAETRFLAFNHAAVAGKESGCAKAELLRRIFFNDSAGDAKADRFGLGMNTAA